MIRKLAGLASVVMALGVVDAQAATLNLTGFNPGSSMVSLKKSGVAYNNVTAGQVQGTLDSVSFLTYCSELDQSISFNTNYTYSIVGTGGAGGFNATQASALGKLYTYAESQVTDSTSSAAFQMAVWEIVYETSGTYSISYGAGSFFETDFNSSIITLANSFLSSSSSVTSTYSIQRLVNSTKQDMVYPTGPIASVPEPATTALMGAGLLLLGYRKRRESLQQNV